MQRRIGDSTWFLNALPKPLSYHAALGVLPGCNDTSRAWIIRAKGLSRQILRVTSNIDAHASRRHVSTALESCDSAFQRLIACAIVVPVAVFRMRRQQSVLQLQLLSRTWLPTGQYSPVESALQSHVGAALCLLVRRATKSEARLSVAHPPSVPSWGGKKKKGISL